MTEADRRRAARATWATTVFHDAEAEDDADVDFWLALSVEERVELVARLSLEAYRRAVGIPLLDPNYSDLLSAFLAREVRFLVVGAYALGVHGRSRATMDFDVWVDATPENAPRIVAALRDFGAPLQGLSETDLSSPGVGVHIGVPPIRIDVLTRLSGLQFADAWDRRVPARFESIECFVIAAEDQVVNKRAAGRPKDLADAAALEKILERRRGG